MVHNDRGPLVATCPIAKIRGAAGLSTRYVIMIRQGLAPHPGLNPPGGI
jgi:hypothetical protein